MAENTSPSRGFFKKRAVLVCELRSFSSCNFLASVMRPAGTAQPVLELRPGSLTFLTGRRGNSWSARWLSEGTWPEEPVPSRECPPRGAISTNRPTSH